MSSINPFILWMGVALLGFEGFASLAIRQGSGGDIVSVFV